MQFTDGGNQYGNQSGNLSGGFLGQLSEQARNMLCQVWTLIRKVAVGNNGSMELIIIPTLMIALHTLGTVAMLNRIYRLTQMI
jgi:hypothetical protein